MQVELNPAELEVLEAALTALTNQYVDVANSFDRSWGPEDHRSLAAWSDVKVKRAMVEHLRRKLEAVKLAERVQECRAAIAAARNA